MALKSTSHWISEKRDSFHPHWAPFPVWHIHLWSFVYVVTCTQETSPFHSSLLLLVNFTQQIASGWKHIIVLFWCHFLSMKTFLGGRRKVQKRAKCNHISFNLTVKRNQKKRFKKSPPCTSSYFTASLVQVMALYLQDRDFFSPFLLKERNLTKLKLKSL